MIGFSSKILKNGFQLSNIGKRWAIVSLILIFSVNLFSGITGKIKGYVKDENGKPLVGANIVLDGTSWGAETDKDGYYYIVGIRAGTYTLKCSFIGYREVSAEIKVKADLTQTLDLNMVPDNYILDEVEFVAKKETRINKSKSNSGVNIQFRGGRANEVAYNVGGINPYPNRRDSDFNTEEYDLNEEIGFKDVEKEGTTTFSIDVDNASYSNIRRFINNGQKPPKGSIRIEEMINYFNYNYPIPEGDEIISVNAELSDSPWSVERKLLHLGLKGKIERVNDINSNYVFLLDVSGSMGYPNKLPLLKESFKLLVNSLKPTDRVSIVVYAGAAGVVLESTHIENKQRILSALNNLNAGGSTAGGAGIKLAYKIAEENLIKGGNNRVILATDGDFNVGTSSTSELVEMMKEKRDKGVFLTILGFGMGNYKDGRMESIADKGNGNYFYIDNINEAKKVLVRELSGTMYTIAKDVKLQLEFNPVAVKSYRLIGYENRMLENEDFENDKKDAGEMGSGHTVTALYELIMNEDGDSDESSSIYQTRKTNSYAHSSGDIVTLKCRYKDPDSSTSKLFTKPIKGAIYKTLDETSYNFKFSAAVAQFGLILRESEFKAESSIGSVIDLAQRGKGDDPFNYRGEFIDLVRKYNRDND
jgi:Ca-activated chloride channel family protein